MAVIACPPTVTTDHQLQPIQYLDEDVKNIFKIFRVPWKVQVIIGAMGYAVPNDIADRWPTKENTRQPGARDLGLLTTEGDGVYNFSLGG